MGSHRLDVTEQRSATAFVGDSATPYVGKRVRQVEATPEWELFAAESPDDTGALPYALTDDFTGSMPKITDEMLYGAPGTDFSSDTTTNLPAIRTGRRRASSRSLPTLIGRVPSLPALVGASALAIAAIGAVTTGSADLAQVEASGLRQASALTGTSGVGVVGNVRVATLSRGGSRTADAQSAADARAEELTKLDSAADSVSDQRLKNQWGLPIEPGVYHLTARFGDSGLWSNRHTGLDFACPTGTLIHAVANGVITSAQFDGAYGNKTVETLDDGTELWYAHQTRFNVKPGEYVHRGQVIGFVGSTGHVTGPHVHLEVRPGGGDPVDPYPALVAQGLQP